VITASLFGGSLFLRALKTHTSLGQAVSSAAALAIAELRGVDERSVVQRCRRNSAKLFGLSQMA
jgi:hypothetical protein